jgi:hypothetical protein
MFFLPSLANLIRQAPVEEWALTGTRGGVGARATKLADRHKRVATNAQAKGGVVPKQQQTQEDRHKSRIGRQSSNTNIHKTQDEDEKAYNFNKCTTNSSEQGWNKPITFKRKSYEHVSVFKEQL